MSFTPLASTFGGVLIGLAATLLLLFNGRIAGISGIVGSLPWAKPGDRSWRALFVAGLLAGGVVMLAVAPSTVDPAVNRPWPALVVAGLLVGIGTRLGSGCTSGHGICGLSRFSKRSLVAVLVFMTSGAGAAIASRLVLGRA
jgi:uncharacterized membrane protein YedE/YeeE